MKNQIFKVSCEELSEFELQETIGGGVVSWLKSCFKPTQVVPMQIYRLPSGDIKLPSGDYLAVFAT